MVARAADPNGEIGDSARSLWDSTLRSLPRVGVAIAIVIVGWLIGRGVRWLLRERLRRHRTPSFAKVISKLTSWLLVVVSVLLALAVTFPSVKPVDLLAGLGFFSVAVGFAFQDILENSLAGVLLLFRQPFRSGDQIAVVGQSGTVVEINIRETRLTTFDGESVIIPNRDVYKNVILVHTDRPTHRLQFDIGIAYDNDPELATTTIVDVLQSLPGIEHDPRPQAVVRELGVSTVNIRALFWTNSRRHESVTVTDAAIKAVKSRLDAEGIEMPAEIIALQATPSLRAALHGTDEITPAGNIRRGAVAEPHRDTPMVHPEQAPR
ncbi:MAG: mechanosensitive ion channel [Ilumatobacteraceae bacterium]